MGHTCDAERKVLEGERGGDGERMGMEGEKTGNEGRERGRRMEGKEALDGQVAMSHDIGTAPLAEVGEEESERRSRRRNERYHKGGFIKKMISDQMLCLDHI